MVETARRAGLAAIAILRPDLGRPARCFEAGPAVENIAALIAHF